MKNAPPELKDTGLKITGPRLIILDFFRKNPHQHLSADDVYDYIRQEKIEIGIATVYRVLLQFEQAGILRRNHFESRKAQGKAIYELDQGEPHDHILCTSCGYIEEFFDPAISERQKTLAEAMGFELVECSLSMYGICKNCLGKKKK